MNSQNNTNTKYLTRPLFADHLEKLELLSLVTRRILDPLPIHANAEKALCLMWDILAQSIPGGGTADISELSTLSSIIQRTASATKQIQSLTDDSIDLTRKALDFETTKQTILQQLSQAASDPETSADITPATIALIERRLRLL